MKLSIREYKPENEPAILVQALYLDLFCELGVCERGRDCMLVTEIWVFSSIDQIVVFSLIFF